MPSVPQSLASIAETMLGIQLRYDETIEWLEFRLQALDQNQVKINELLHSAAAERSADVARAEAKADLMMAALQELRDFRFGPASVSCPNEVEVSEFAPHSDCFAHAEVALVDNVAHGWTPSGRCATQSSDLAHDEYEQAHGWTPSRRCAEQSPDFAREGKEQLAQQEYLLEDAPAQENCVSNTTTTIFTATGADFAGGSGALSASDGTPQQHSVESSTSSKSCHVANRAMDTSQNLLAEALPARARQLAELKLAIQACLTSPELSVDAHDELSRDMRGVTAASQGGGWSPSGAPPEVLNAELREAAASSRIFCRHYLDRIEPNGTFLQCDECLLDMSHFWYAWGCEKCDYASCEACYRRTHWEDRAPTLSSSSEAALEASLLEG